MPAPSAGCRDMAGPVDQTKLLDWRKLQLCIVMEERSTHHACRSAAGERRPSEREGPRTSVEQIVRLGTTRSLGSTADARSCRGMRW